METLCSSLKGKIDLHFIIGMMKDKEVEEMVKPILNIADSVTVVSPSIPRALSVEELTGIISELNSSVEIESYSSISEGVESFSSKDGLHVVTGSFFTVSEVMSCLNRKPYGR